MLKMLANKIDKLIILLTNLSKKLNYIAMNMIEACKNGNLERVQELVALNADIHADNDNVIRRASEYGHIEVVKYLVELNADIHADNDYALRWASNYGHVDIVKYLIVSMSNYDAVDNNLIDIAYVLINK